MFNPFEHFYELPLQNVFGGEFFGLKRPDFMPLPDGQQVATAVPGQPESVTYWLRGDDAAYHEITQEQAFAQLLWMHFRYGMEIGSAFGAGGDDVFRLHDPITPQELLTAIATMPNNLDEQLQQYTPQEIVDYALSVAPDHFAVDLVGVTEPAYTP